MNNASKLNYIIISPVKDEEKYVETTIRAVLRQTIRPLKWIIVDDGSRDATSDVIGRYSKECSWISTLRIDRDARRQLGSAEVRAFDCGYRLIEDVAHDFIVKLDCDVDLPTDYFERLISRFQEDETLGICSGVYLERKAGRWQPVKMPAYHASGASKTVRAECFRQIGGFILCPGWDTVDEIKARAVGWKTRCFEDLTFYHLKPEGSASGYLKIAFMCGEIDYRSGLPIPFFFLKVLYRLTAGHPVLLGGLAMLAGFLKALILRRPKLVERSEAKLYRRMLNERIVERISTIATRVRLIASQQV